MLFNTITFWAFFFVVVLGYWRLNGTPRKFWLLAANLVFYGWWDWRFLGLLGSAILVSYFCALKIGDSGAAPGRRKLWLGIAVTWLLGWLFFFKYFGWFVESLVAFADLVGMGEFDWVFRVALPIGISFFTFQLLSYLVDVFRRSQEPTSDLLSFSLYVSFFPQLVAGPIERNESLQPQLESPPSKLDGERFREGLYLVLHGLFLKVVIADNLAPVVNSVFGRVSEGVTFPEVLAATYAFAFQVYGDFAGYSSIGRGVAKWLGIDLMVNFRNPYFADNPSDFWRRWHISLSAALRDYIFIPLSMGGSGLRQVMVGLFLTMLLGGIWHGAAWTFVAWGVFHGIWLSVDAAIRRARSGRREATTSWGRVIKVLVCFHLVCLSYVFFRAETMRDAWTMISSIASPWDWTHFSLFAFAYVAFFCVPLLAYEFWLERRRDLLAICFVGWPWRAALYIVILAGLLFFPAPNKYEFVYFRF